MMYVNGKGTVFPIKLKLEGKLFKKETRKKNFEKDAMYFIKTIIRLT